ncbi:hypothetical protein Q7A53_07115 [Halobacillus rhizosphaerae]|uniref:hypothetical protein n=1 Tax=Halobacillus rhizosphaerae TaxID=3064889 RepID=UPI00398ABF87
MYKTKVISIASVSGGGKTAVTKELRNRFRHAETLFFDNYDFHGAPDDLTQWVKEGPDYNQWNLDPLIADLKSLIEGDVPPEYIIMDYPFSYKNDKLKNFIDLSIYIETPLDIAMGRRLIRDFPYAASIEILNDIEFYLISGRDAYLEMEDTIKPNADFIMDGAMTVSKLVDAILKKLKIESSSTVS